MNIIKRQIFLPGEREVNILIPRKTCPDITATDNNKGYYYMLSNGTGYSILTDIFALATSLEKNELVYFPLEFAHMGSYTNDFPGENHCKGIVLFNYITTQINVKDISGALKTKTFKEEILTRQASYSEEYPDRWNTHHKLTVKKAGKLLIISGERAVFTLMAQSCARLSEYGDDSKYNEYSPHMHHDWDENTSKSIGITFYYWHRGDYDK